MDCGRESEGQAAEPGVSWIQEVLLGFLCFETASSSCMSALGAIVVW